MKQRKAIVCSRSNSANIQRYTFASMFEKNSHCSHCFDAVQVDDAYDGILLYRRDFRDLT